jgi:L-idonate 5-dehydrogenase
MKIKTQSCVVAGKQTVDVTDQEIEWNNKGTLVQITRGGFVDPIYIIIRKAR